MNKDEATYLARPGAAVIFPVFIRLRHTPATRAKAGGDGGGFVFEEDSVSLV